MARPQHQGLEQLLLVDEKLQVQATSTLPKAHPQLGNLVAVDGALIAAVPSMTWAITPQPPKRPRFIVALTSSGTFPEKSVDGKGDERPLVPRLRSAGRTEVGGLRSGTFLC
jgi:hypothetical protein